MKKFGDLDTGINPNFFIYANPEEVIKAHINNRKVNKFLKSDKDKMEDYIRSNNDNDSYNTHQNNTHQNKSADYKLKKTTTNFLGNNSSPENSLNFSKMQNEENNNNDNSRIHSGKNIGLKDVTTGKLEIYKNKEL